MGRSRQRPGWTRHPGPTGGTCGAAWVHESGWFIMHCGHPTALWPYYGNAPQSVSNEELHQVLSLAAPLGKRCGDILVAPSGRAFGKLLDAQLAVERIVWRRKHPDSAAP